MSDEGKAAGGSRWPQAERLMKVFEDPLRIKILGECNLREMSPRSFRDEFGGASLAKVAAAFDVLAQYEWLERTRTERGAELGEVEHFYRGTGEAIVEDPIWSDFPDSMKALIGWRVFEGLSAEVRAAMKAGKIGARADEHFTWKLLLLDRQGWETTILRLDSLFYSLAEEQEKARMRMAKSGEEPVTMTVGLLAFESPERTN